MGLMEEVVCYLLEEVVVELELVASVPERIAASLVPGHNDLLVAVPTEVDYMETVLWVS